MLIATQPNHLIGFFPNTKGFKTFGNINSALIADVDASLSISVKENLRQFSVLVSNPLDGSNSTSFTLFALECY